MSRVSVKPGTGPEHPTTPPEYIWNTPGTPSAPPQTTLDGVDPRDIFNYNCLVFSDFDILSLIKKPRTYFMF